MFELCQSSVTERASASVSALADSFGQCRFVGKPPVSGLPAPDGNAGGRRKGGMPTYDSGRAVAYSPQLSLLKDVRLGCRI